jgi:HD-GYP domain-containing protein (c-di-GMP phosphodiesterase class II)
MPQLRIKAGLDRGKVFDIVDESTKIGRDVSCKVQLNENGVSREHAEIYRVGEMFFIRDLGSRNGIMVNEMNVEDELLRDGDAIRLCSYVLVFESVAAAAEGHQEHFYDDQDPGETMVMNFESIDSQPGMANISKASLRIGQLVRDTARIENLLDGVLDTIFELVDVMEVFIFVLEPGQKLAQKAYRKIDSAEKGKASRSIVLRALKDKTTIVTANAMDDFRFKAENSVFLKNVNSVLCCPLISLGQDVGVIYLNNGPEHEPFSQDSAELVQRIGTHLALGIQNLDLRKSETSITDKSVRLIADTTEHVIPSLMGRGKRVAAMANAIGKVMGLKRPQLVNLHVASCLHHLGYSELGRKTDFNFETLRDDLSYVAKSVDILQRHDSFVDALNAIEYHRFRIDGKGTPAKLDVAMWSVESQILGLCVELDIRLNLPLAFGRDPQGLGEVAEYISKEGTSLVTRPIITIFEKAWKKSLILAQ